MRDLDIIFEDEDLIVCYKPAGIATQTKRVGQQDMESLIRNYRARKKEAPYVGIVHRLDQPVEGVMVFAKNSNAAAALSKQVRERSIGKHYYAIVDKLEESLLQDKGELTDYMTADERNNLAKITEMSDPLAKEARLEYQVVKRIDHKECMDILLHTGRHHQIRVQFANAKAPLVGDLKYADIPAKHLALCSYRIQFVHPRTKKKMDFKILPKGEEFGAFLDNAGNLS